MSWTLLNGDAIDMLKTLPDESIHCCVTSPPYWGLRDYGVDGQLGLEPTPEEYVANMVEVFREVKRVLRKDGTLWLNLGDCYASDTKGSGGHNPKQDSNTGSWAGNIKLNHGLKPKDLVGIPWRVAFALQADGWWLRSDIIWAKPNPMPESVTDRPTKAHEYIFLLTKSEKYFYDADAIKEDAINGDPTSPRGSKGNNTLNSGLRKQDAINKRQYTGFNERYQPLTKRNKRTVWTIATKPFSGAKLLADYVGVDGKPYKVSPDCPIHAHHERYQKSCTPLYDEQREEMPPRMFDNDDCLGQEYVSEQKSKTCHSRAGDSYENTHGHTPENIGDCKSCVDRSEHTLDAQTPCHTSHIQGPHGGLAYKKDLRSHECFEIANEHNTENHKTDHDLQTFRHGISCAQNPSHIPNIELPGEQSDLAGRNYGSNTSAPCSTDNQNSQMACRNEHIFHDKESLSALNITSSKLYCTCRLVSTDHFATFPPELPEICIKAGCPECGTVLDPFAGAGTTLWVAEQLGVNSIGIELNPEYCEIINRRMAGIEPDLFSGEAIT